MGTFQFETVFELLSLFLMFLLFYQNCSRTTSVLNFMFLKPKFSFKNLLAKYNLGQLLFCI